MKTFLTNPHPYNTTTGEPINTLGMWFYFELDSHKVALWSSYFSGLHKLYVNNKLVSEKRRFGFRNTQIFDIDNTEYCIALELENILLGVYNCSLGYADKRKTIDVQTKRVKSTTLLGVAGQGLVYGYFFGSLSALLVNALLGS